MIKGFVSDMDGTVVNSETLCFESTKMFLEKFGIEFSKKDFSDIIGYTEIEAAKLLKEKFKISLSIDYIFSERRKFLEALNENAYLIEDYLRLISLLKNNNVKISLASSSPKKLIEKTLKRNAIEQHFIASVSAEEVGSKVNAYKTAVEKMGLRTSECFALEDSVFGARAAKDAGLYCVLIPNEFMNGHDTSFVDEVHKSIRDFLHKGKVLKELS
ncbi:MAG TPA: HAD family phosphatase [archaeon]|nr:HAD family phosphatase [archaeon]